MSRSHRHQLRNRHARLTAFFILLASLVLGAPVGAVDPHELLPSMFLLVLLTALVWVLMLLARNISVAIGKASVRYYESYRNDAPPEWIERPARTFMNLLEVPLLFYVACLLMLSRSTAIARSCPASDLRRDPILHALVYIGVNPFPPAWT